MRHLTHSLRPHAGDSYVIEANAAGRDSAPGTSRVTVRDQVHGARYGEVLLVTGRLNRIEATVYNTLGLNDCPDDLWRALDAEAIKKALSGAGRDPQWAPLLSDGHDLIADPGERDLRLWRAADAAAGDCALPMTSLLAVSPPALHRATGRRTTVYG